MPLDALAYFSDPELTELPEHISPETAVRIDKLAREKIKLLTSEMKRRFHATMRFGAELEFAPFLSSLVKAESEKQSFLENLIVVTKIKSLLQKKSPASDDGLIELKTKPVEPLKLLDNLVSIKSKLINKANELATQFSFFEFSKEKYPNMHLNFSLRLFNGYTNQIKKQTRKLLQFIFYNLSNDLANAFYLFYSGKNSIHRFNNGLNSTERHVRQHLKYPGYGATRYKNNFESEASTSRFEFRSSDFTGIDSVKTLFLMASVFNSLDKIWKIAGDQIENSVNRDTKLRSIDKILEQNFDGQAFNVSNDKSMNIPIPMSLRKAYRQFETDSFNRVRNLLGDEIYNLMLKPEDRDPSLRSG